MATRSSASVSYTHLGLVPASESSTPNTDPLSEKGNTPFPYACLLYTSQKMIAFLKQQIAEQDEAYLRSYRENLPHL